MKEIARCVVIAIVGLVLGYYLGREHLKHEMAKALTGIVSAVVEPFGGNVRNSDRKSDAMRKTRDAYAKTNLTLYDIGLSNSRVSGKIKNAGDRTINRLEVTAYLLDDSGKAMAEKSYPVISAFLLSGDGPLRPNYIRNFEFPITSAPSEWKNGKANFAITDIEFEE
jgi:hypothetical protein